MSEKIAIIGAGMTKFGEHWDTSLRALASQAIFDAISNVEKGIERSEIQGLVVGNAGAGILNNQTNVAALIADHAGLKCPAIRVEAADASGGLAIRSAIMMIKSGMADIVVVCGVEKMTDQVEAATLTSMTSTALDAEWEALLGQTLAGAYGIIANEYLKKYNATKRMLASVPAKNHANAVYNRTAQFRRAFTVDQILKSAYVADPLTLLDSSPSSDGAAALILTKESLASKFTDNPVYIIGSGQGVDVVAIHDREEIASFKATKMAAKEAFKMAGITSDQVKVAELHDSYSIGEILALEDIGFFPAGKGGEATLNGETNLGSDKVVVNPSGGLKALGHPLGATGVAQAVEIYHQLLNTVEKERQTNAEFGLTQSVAGAGSNVIIHIFAK